MIAKISAPAGRSDRSRLDVGATLGVRLRSRRRVRNLSLKEIAERAGISIGLLSQIERDLTAPSVKSMIAICHALEMPVGWLFDTGSHAEQNAIIVRRHQRRVLDLGPKRMVKELLTPDTCPGIQMMRLMIRPGGSTGEIPYSHKEGAKCGTILSGELGLEVDGTEYRIGAGDSFAFPATSRIRFWCAGNTETDLLWVVSPAAY